MNSYDKKLEDLELELAYTQKRIQALKKEKAAQEAIEKKDNLIRNSVKLNEVELERHDDQFFIVAKDSHFNYVIRLDKYQAEVLADALDYELSLKEEVKTPEISDEEFITDLIQNLFRPIIDNTKQ